MRSDSHATRAQKVFALDYCAASFVTEGETKRKGRKLRVNDGRVGEVKYCIAKLFSGDVKFATALDY